MSWGARTCAHALGISQRVAPPGISRHLPGISPASLRESHELGLLGAACTSHWDASSRHVIGNTGHAHRHAHRHAPPTSLAALAHAPRHWHVVRPRRLACVANSCLDGDLLSGKCAIGNTGHAHRYAHRHAHRHAHASTVTSLAASAPSAGGPSAGAPTAGAV